jgi:hypothetical protein
MVVLGEIWQNWLLILCVESQRFLEAAVEIARSQR